MIPETIGIVGLGAIGGSLAWRASTQGIRVVGATLVPRDGARALRAGAIADFVLAPEKLVGEVEVLVLAAPPDRNLTLMQELAPRLRDTTTVVTDVSSVQAPLARCAAETGLADRFVGSHPLRGTRLVGFDAASPDLLVGALVYVTAPDPGAPLAREIADFWTRVIGASVVMTTPEAHDRQLAWTSHLPQAVSSALASALAQGAPTGVALGPGALDTTKLAVSSVEMWSSILLHNRYPILEALAAHRNAIDQLSSLLEAGDRAGLEAWLDRAARYRREVGS